MAQTGFTPIQLYRTSTAAAAPTAGNLADGELAININPADMALFAKTASGSVTRLMNNPVGLLYPTVDGSANGLLQTNGSKTLTFTNTPTVTSINKVAITAPATGSTLTISDGKTLSATNTLTLSGTDSTTMTFPPASASVGYLNLPVNSQSAAYTAVLADSGKLILHPSTDANARTFTIPANASVAYPDGTVLTFINMTSQVVTIAITSDTMYLAGSGSTGSRTLAQFGVATAVKLTSTTWLISGSGLT